MISICMKNFDEIIAPYLTGRKPRVKYIVIGQKPKPGRITHSKPVRTPLGDFISITEAAKAHNVPKDAISKRLLNQKEGYEYL